MDIKNFKRSIARSGEIFLSKIFTDLELTNRDPIHLAGIFSLKEAMVKVGIIKPGNWLNIEIKNSHSGEPLVFKKGVLLKNIALSTTHSRDSAISVVMIYNN